MNNKVYINEKELGTWGSFLEAGSYASLMQGGPMKDYVEVDFRDQDGREVLIQNPRVDGREFTINLVVRGKNPAEMLSHYELLMTELRSGNLILRVPDLNYTIRCCYRNSEHLNYFTPNVITLSVTLYEFNPTNRGPETMP